MRKIYFYIIFAISCAACDRQNQPDADAKLLAEIPSDLRPLKPLADRWGVENNYIRWEMLRKSSAEERKEIVGRVQPLDDAITQWLITFDDPENLPEPAKSYMYLQMTSQDIQSSIHFEE